MDAKDLLEHLKADLTCSICLGYFTDPVTVKCGHNFCTECLLQYRKKANGILNCPECRHVIHINDLVPNKRLQNLSTTGKVIRLHLLQSMVGLTICNQHWEKEKLFCEEDQKSICESCFLAPEHKGHQVLPLDKAAEKGKEKLQQTGKILQRKEVEFKISLDKMRRKVIQHKVSVYAIKQSVTTEYEKIHDHLWDEEYTHLQRLDQESRDNLEEIKEMKVKLSQQIQNLQQMLLEVEGNLDKAPLKMIQDTKDILGRNQELLLQKPEIILPKWSTFSILGLREMLMSYQRDITLDPETAHPQLILSEDLKSVTYTSVPQDVPDNNKRFDCALAVLGTQTFTSGKHYWEVKMENQMGWSVGIFTDSVSRRGKLTLLFKNIRILAGFKYGNNFYLWNIHGFLESPPVHKLGIFLDYEMGHIAFYDVSRRSVLYSPPNKDFQGPLLPYLSPCCPNKEWIPWGPWSNEEMVMNDPHCFGRLSLIRD
ncbi:putative E3 ubiquitin-protein ligase TRIML1 [Macrotis lagotis]|uniref:putative E3 ubiquitin-protein ligase TRIML1 n=1 Tax=Macrotis lagotis TaxID=92651 RepID=UPI003D68AED8